MSSQRFSTEHRGGKKWGEGIRVKATMQAMLRCSSPMPQATCGSVPVFLLSVIDMQPLQRVKRIFQKSFDSSLTLIPSVLDL